MKNIKNIFYTGMLVLCIMNFASCSDDEEVFDFPGDPYNRVYLLDTSSSYRIVQTPMIAASNLDFKTTLRCTREASADIKGTVEIDNSMIDAYNEENETEYEALPTTALLIEDAIMTIPAGSMVATDTMHVTISDDQSILSTLKSEKGYLVPLRLTTIEGGNGDAQVSTNIFFTYLIFTVDIKEENINHTATESDITGTLVADQSGWSVTTNSTVSSNPITAIFDGDARTYCSISNNSEDIIININMGKIYTFDAISFYYTQNSWGWDYTYGSFSNGMTIQTSNDGSTWSSDWAGTFTKTSTFCAFYAPITTQYIRIVKPKGNSSNVSLSAGVFNVYAK